jgi:trimeric autotransporter adhesin
MHRSPSIWQRLVALWMVHVLITLPLRANPQGEQVVAGSANFERTGSTLQITTSDKVIINWTDFSIGSGELTRFIQPSSSSSALNKVISGNPSSILGSLEANGNIYLINPNGILVGSGANINANSFIGSTLDIDDSQFLSGGDLNFSGSSTAGIQNLGAIRGIGGDVFLLAHQVENQGTIDAAAGTVGLGAGTDFLLKQAGEERLFVRPPISSSAPTVSTSDGVKNTGLIQAAQAELKANGNVYQFAINNSGSIRANGFQQKDGRVLLTSVGGGHLRNSGTITARKSNGDGGSIIMKAESSSSGTPSSAILTGVADAAGLTPGARGGEVQILADHVGLFESAKVDVSGDQGGGTALIGGDYQGLNAHVQNAQKTLVGSGAAIKADAITQGDGGKVILWADDTTRYFGTISARGGAIGGDGGFVEVSGKGFLDFHGYADLFAAYGQQGSLLLDPTDIVIDSSADNPAALADQILTFAENVGTTMTIGASTLAAIGSGTITLEATNDILVSSAVTLTGNVSLTMRAQNEIRVNAALAASGTGSINLEADLDVELSAAVSTSGTGTITLHADHEANGSGSVFLLTGGSVSTANQTITIRGSNLAITAGTINAGTGTIAIQPTGTTGGASLGGASGTFSVDNAEIQAMTAGLLQLTANGSTLFLQGFPGTHSIGSVSLIGNGNNIQISGTPSLPSLSLNVAGSSTITQSTAFTATSLNITSVSGAVTLDNTANDLGTLSLSTGTSTVTLDDGGNLLVAGVSGSGTVDIAAGGDLTLTGAFTSSSATLSAGNATAGNFISSSTITTGGLSILGDDITIGGNVSVTGMVVLNADQDITISSGVTMTHSGSTANFYTLSADRHITMNGTIVGAGHDVFLVSDADLDNVGGITMAGTVTSGGGDVNLDAFGISLSSTAAINAGAGFLTLIGGGSTIDLSTSTLTTTSASGAALEIGDASTVALGNLNAASGTLKLGSSTDPITGAVTQNTGTVINASILDTFATGGTFSLTENNTIGFLGTIVRGGDFVLNDISGGLSVSGAITGGTTANTVTITTAGGPLTLSGNITATDMNLTGAGIIQGSSSLLTSANTLVIDANGGDLSMSGDIVSTGTTSTAVVIRDTSSTAATLGDITVSGAGGGLVLGVSGDILGNLSQTGGTSISTPKLKVSTAGTVTLNNSGNQIAILENVNATQFSLVDSAGGMTLTGTINTGSGSVTLSSTGAAFHLLGSITGGTVTLNAFGGDLTQSTVSSITAGLAFFSASSGNVHLVSDLNDITTLDFSSANSATGDFILHDQNGLIVDDHVIAGDEIKVVTKTGDMVISNLGSFRTSTTGKIMVGAGDHFRNLLSGGDTDPFFFGAGHSGDVLVFTENPEGFVAGGFVPDAFVFGFDILALGHSGGKIVAFHQDATPPPPPTSPPPDQLQSFNTAGYLPPPPPPGGSLPGGYVTLASSGISSPTAYSPAPTSFTMAPGTVSDVPLGGLGGASGTSPNNAGPAPGSATSTGTAGTRPGTTPPGGAQAGSGTSRQGTAVGSQSRGGTAGRPATGQGTPGTAGNRPNSGETQASNQPAGEGGAAGNNSQQPGTAGEQAPAGEGEMAQTQGDNQSEQPAQQGEATESKQENADAALTAEKKDGETASGDAGEKNEAPGSGEAKEEVKTEVAQTTAEQAAPPANDERVLAPGGATTMDPGGLSTPQIVPPVLQKAVSVEVRQELQTYLQSSY